MFYIMKKKVRMKILPQIILTLPNSEELSSGLRHQLKFVAVAVFLRTSTSNTSTFYRKIEIQNKFCIVGTLKVLKRKKHSDFKTIWEVIHYPLTASIQFPPFLPNKPEPLYSKNKVCVYGGGEGVHREEKKWPK